MSYHHADHSYIYTSHIFCHWYQLGPHFQSDPSGLWREQRGGGVRQWPPVICCSVISGAAEADAPGKPKGMAWAYISQVQSDRQRRRIWCKPTPGTQWPGTACTVHANQTTISAVNNNRHIERGRRREKKVQTHQHTTHAHTHTLTSKTCTSFNTIAADAQKGGIRSSDL